MGMKEEQEFSLWSYRFKFHKKVEKFDVLFALFFLFFTMQPPSRGRLTHLGADAMLMKF